MFVTVPLLVPLFLFVIIMLVLAFLNSFIVSCPSCLCRLLQGSECPDEIVTTEAGKVMHTSKWVTEERTMFMKNKLSKMRLTVEHIVEHINEPLINRHVLHEIHEHLDTLDLQINKFHSVIESAAAKWMRSKALPETQIGDKLPMNMVLPVTIDCFVDGFLIGVSVAISPKAGFILAIANCFEMSFLGMAYASRLVKCTGSAEWLRNLAIYGPPFVMFFAAGVGAALADSARNSPLVFVAFVAFGVVALLFLVCNELLIEAKSAQGDEERWWISVNIFLGVYMVLMINQLT
jgi:zinc transporter ZupT